MQDLVGPALGTLALVAVGGYLLGSIPFGVILTRLATGEDVRSIGSGNIGATNVLRTGRKDLAIATLLLDAGKGAAAYLIVQALFPGVPALAAVAGGSAFLGHLFPVWLGFKGGKGVATFFGLLLAAAWPLGLMAGAVWLIVAALFRMSSLAALIAAVTAPLLALLPLPLMGLPAPAPIVALAVATAVLIWIRHHENIARILKGAEPRIGAKKG
ncbi:glycerol-3-phosphate 1-O-acyltransferase PlsY [Brevundimonas sp.]|uniref:glycerol-3-phosphate 1-O-acyltransferase PlsY n=1 Tax=Brevundimonas sp. TaxID=1871086 RepID=UPI0011F43216|nr:glycerol-3-phosphate 1-O-acyltransferase PlsY [Brevundimonas sp.]TAJ55532.1 MAG: glycerol-3-phosphate 1-O-acyltransferase [Brevundimonas sp.]